ncbi:MbnP family protein [Polluticoccus soli]|uniref:MbnP family protein n=1 Tax=Polluticoccus soli TaxID=3034150 RepID=UPI0023E31E54|nr:MbnP family protein [Flavipsychrobacter sp. JY13-12]
MSKRRFCFLGAAIIMAISCRKRPDPIGPPITSSLTLQFENMVGDRVLRLDSTVYTNANNDSFIVNKYRYYISNIILITAEGKNFVEPESYHLIKEDLPSSKKFSISNVPAGQYTKIQFLIGVDSLRNVSGAQTGALDPSHTMFWDWETGYIMAMFEGKRVGTEDLLIMHISGFKPPYNSIRQITLSLPSPVQVKEGIQPNIHITSDLAEWFKTPNLIDFDEIQITAGGSIGLQIADNYADMFKIDHVD